ncbi:helix-turn-helix domain-containing protein [Bacillus sp. KH172YL63]|uniref:helix-turn-helix domain-containing protein n=1 Tax=Bacillus sp. KH172YL63 TaxID=2709784 RepID=UPI0013E43DEB|nr:helix-turn-helix domain-containing protein [Bacillus sp. KH172YL63]BCB04574.1 hypothetical protein KH172YL63_27070 [Bacillus sp. KH172YL63]
MTYLNYVILYCLKQINEERSIYAVFHILKGKKSSQSIQDAHIFKLQPFFLSLPKLKRSYFNQKILELESARLIKLDETEKAAVLDAGSLLVKEHFYGESFPSRMDGLQYGDLARLFWLRLSLLVQVLSNAKKKETLYFPVQRNRQVQEWVKHALKANPDIDRFTTELHHELYSSLTTQATDPSILVFRLTGYDDFGWTERQVADMLKMDREEYRFRFLNLLHGLLSEIARESSKFPLLYSMGVNREHSQNLTISTSKTYDLYKRGHSIEEIARIRNLKINTIEDHIIELALTKKDFGISPFITAQDYDDVIHAMNDMQTRRLKPIKDKLPQLSYFQIRVAIAKAGEGSGFTSGA